MAGKKRLRREVCSPKNVSANCNMRLRGCFAFLDGVIGERAFKLAVALLVIGNDRNQWSNYAGRLVRGASAENGEQP
jgi:hypothetical protein